MKLRACIETDGYVIVEPGLTPDELGEALSHATLLDFSLKNAGQGGLRDICRRAPALAALASHRAVRRVVSSVLGDSAFAVRCILFDKRDGANWKVPWHQDLTIAVRERATAPGFGPWSVKGGIPHVQPPARVLEQMLAVRVHLDDCGPTNGPLRVRPGSHRFGRLSEPFPMMADDVACPVVRGGLLAMRPLLLHASSAASNPARRRVLHLEFAACELDDSLEWHERW